MLSQWTCLPLQQPDSHPPVLHLILCLYHTVVCLLLCYSSDGTCKLHAPPQTACSCMGTAAAITLSVQRSLIAVGSSTPDHVSKWVILNWHCPYHGTLHAAHLHVGRRIKHKLHTFPLSHATRIIYVYHYSFVQSPHSLQFPLGIN